MASMDFILGVLGLGGKAVGAMGQKKAAQFCYKVYQRNCQIWRNSTQTIPVDQRITEPPDWEDMTQRQQESWMSAVWDIADIDSKLIPKDE